jgi:hypothetical protein
MHRRALGRRPRDGKRNGLTSLLLTLFVRSTVLTRCNK